MSFSRFSRVLTSYPKFHKLSSYPKMCLMNLVAELRHTKMTMPAKQRYLTSLHQSFATFLTQNYVSGEIARQAQNIYLKLLGWKDDYDLWSVEEIERFLAETQINTPISSQVKSLLIQFVKDFPPHQANIFLHQYLLAVKGNDCSPATVRNYRSDIRQYVRFSGTGKLEVLFTKPKLAKFVHQQLDKGLKKSSITRKLSSIAQFGWWLQTEGLLTQDLSWIDQVTVESLTAVKTHQNNSSRSSQPNTTAHFRPGVAKKRNVVSQNQRFNLKKKLRALTNNVKRVVPAQTRRWLLPYLNLAFIVLVLLGLGYFGYRQLFVETTGSLAYPSAPTRPNRVLSFQGRLTDSAQNPLTTSTNMRFYLYDALTGGSSLWDSTTCAVTPDQDGIFTVNLGDDCGSEISEDVFSENANIWLEASVEAETLTPRQPIRTVAYALNAETLQGYPIDASGSATVNTILTMNEVGDIVLGEVSPKIKAVSGNFSLEGEALTLTTTPGSNGDITLDPDGVGGINLLSDLDVSGSASVSANLSLGGQLQLGRFLSDPTAIGAGSMYFNTTDNKLYYYDSSSWTEVGSGGGDSYWRLTDGALSPVNDTLDLLIGGTASSSANFAFLNNNSGTPTASVSGNLTLNSAGEVQTTNNQLLTLGGDTTGDIYLNGNVGIGTSSPVNTLNVNGNIRVDGGNETTPAILLNDTNSGIYGGSSGFYYVFDGVYRWNMTATSISARAGGQMKYDGNANDIANPIFSYSNDSNTGLAFGGSDILTLVTGGLTRMYVNPSGLVGINTTSPTHTLDVSGTGRFTGSLELDSTLLDTNDSAGTSGQLLSSTGSAVDWIDAAAVGTDDQTLLEVYQESGNAVEMTATYGDVRFYNDASDEMLFLDESTGNVGIGTATPTQELDLVGDINLENTTSDDTGIIYKDGTRFIHNFQHPTGGTAVPFGHNTFVGLDAGNLTMGSTATEPWHGSNNTGVGYRTLYSNTTGFNNTASGLNALYFNTTGQNNVASGADSLYSNTTGNYNTASGGYTLYSNTTGSANTASGVSALYSNTTGYYNTASGFSALYTNTTGSANTASGYNAGSYIADGSTGNATSTNSLYLGANTKALADGDTNEMVLGYNTTGFGSNTAAYGNSSMTKHIFQAGNVGIGTTSPASLLTVGNGDLFQVNSSGIIAAIDGVAHTIEDIGGNLTLTSAGSAAVSIINDLYVSSGISTFGTAVSDGTIEATKFCTGDGETNCVSDFSSLGGGLFTDGGTYVYPTDNETLGNSASAGSNKIAGLYLADSAPLTFGVNNDIEFSFSGSELATTLGTNTWNIASNLLFLNGSSSRIGINTGSPLATLDIRSTLGTIPTASISGNTSMASLVVDQSGTGDIFAASSSGKTRFVVGSDGNVGIGVQDPSSKLEIGGSTSTISNDSGDITINAASNFISLAGDSLGNLLDLSIAGDASISGSIAYDGASPSTIDILNGNRLDFQTSVGGDAGLGAVMSILNNGNIGIGDTTPSQKLDVNGNIQAAIYYDKANPAYYLDPASSSTSLAIAGNASVSGQLTFDGSSPASINALNGNDIAFKTSLGEDAGLATRLFVDNGGNVGIGTTNPGQKLEVNGNLKLSPANPTIYSGSSHINIPNGLYVSGGTLYAQNTLMARNGIQNDSTGDSGYVRIKDSLLVDSWIRTSGNTGWYNQSYGGGWYMTDSTWIRAYGNKDIISGGKIRADGGLYVGDDEYFWSDTNGRIATDDTFYVRSSSTNTYLYSTNTYLGESSGDTTRLRGNNFVWNQGIIEGNGNVGIGTTTPGAKLEVAGTAWINSIVGGKVNGVGNFHVDTTGTGAFYINHFSGSGGVYVMNGAAGYGVIRASAFIVSSDRNLKENISYLENTTEGLNKILQLEPVSFDYINGDENNLGFIAQDVQGVIPEAVSIMDKEKGTLGITNSFITPYLVNAIKELNTKIQDLTQDFQAGVATIQDLTTDTLTVTQELISPLIKTNQIITDSSLTITKDQSFENNDPLLVVEGEIQAASISARIARLEELDVDTIRANNIIAGNTTLLGSLNTTGNATISGSLLTSEINTDLVNTATLSANTIVATHIEATSSRIAALEAGMAELENVKATTANIVNSTTVDATVSGTLYATKIEGLDDQLATALNSNSFLDKLLGQKEVATQSASVASVFSLVEEAGYATHSGTLVTPPLYTGPTSDVSLVAASAFINDYFSVNGSGYIAQQLGVGEQLLVGNNLALGNNYLEYQPIDPTTPRVLNIQPSGQGTLSLMAGLMTLHEDGQILIDGDLAISGDLEVGGTLLADLIEPSNFNQPLQLKLATESGVVAGVATASSRFEILNQLDTPTATISATGRGSFAGGLKIGTEDLTPISTMSATITSQQPSGKATIRKNTLGITIKSALITTDSLIYVSPIGSTGNQILYVKSQTAEDLGTLTQEGGFSVGFDVPITTDTTFNWWIVN